MIIFSSDSTGDLQTDCDHQKSICIYLCYDISDQSQALTFSSPCE